jgi:hypothetical protein
MSNHLFGTDFSEMDIDKGFSQTTLGIWGAADLERKLLVLDVEGSDLNERQDTNVETAHTLLAMSVSDVIFLVIKGSDIYSLN